MVSKTAPEGIVPDSGSSMAKKSTSESSNRNAIDPIISPPQPDAQFDYITQDTHPGVLAINFPTSRKWMILTVIFLVQTSMNLNTSLYANGQSGIAEEFGVDRQTTVTGAAIFLILYAIGCELWAPWSEEIGRWLVLQLSLLLVNLACLPVALARPDGPTGISSIFVGRAFGGLFSAGGSVTLGMVADMFPATKSEAPLAFIVLSSVGGSIVGPIVGGFIETYSTWRVTIWTQFAFGACVELLHLFLVPETRDTVRLDKHAKALRKKNIMPKACGPTEHKTWRQYLLPREMGSIWFRSFRMLFTEPIVMVLSALSGFSDALIFMQIQSIGLVFSIWHFSTIQIGLHILTAYYTFISFGIAYLAAYILYLLTINRNRRLREAKPDCEHAQYESRLWSLLFTAPLLPIGLFIFAWTSTPSAPWIAPLVGCILIGIANYNIYMTTIDYMVAAYEPYSASATGGNGFARDFLAGVLTWCAAPYYKSFHGTYALQSANSVLACISVLLFVSTVVVYIKGPSLRKRSPFAQSLRPVIGQDWL
ncbi:major facilitator superfamily domain-containing protein [Astrocystis sublimbata]|nr:major facilitator superfamily domain-containing protein [Astrocystis sublimbata]